uniref:Uncharacterized protein n=1 Tax=Tanacetum cinerariifolium TaxID=118510 RepID=A0A6L2JP63_TANCI|nr:hypothetical protein [Tanacetum cinerariifolium]
MADENILAPAPTRSDDQILPFAAWVPIGKSNFVLDLQKKQKNPIFQISEDILQNIKFFRAFKITPIDQAYQFVSPPFGDAIMHFVNELGYIEVIHFVSRMAVNNLYQPWRAILFMINQCLTGKTSGSHNIHHRSTYLFHHAKEDLRLGNRKFVPKGEADEVFRMLILNELISNNIRNAPYYNAYLEIVAKHNRKIAVEKEGNKKTTTAKQPKLKPAKEKSSKPAPTPIPKVTKKKSTKPSLAKKAIMGKVTNVQNVKSSFQLVDEADEEPAQLEPKPELEYQCMAIRENVAEATHPLPVDDTFANIIHNSPSPTDAKTCADTNKTSSGGDTKILQIDGDQRKDVDEQARLDFRVSRVAFAGPNPEPTHEEFMANVYPDVHESLKFPADEHVILEEPLSSSETFSSMKNLDDAYTIGDQFLNDKSTEDKQATTTTTAKTLPLPPPPQQQSSTNSDLAARVTALERKFADLEQKNQTLATTSQNLGSRVCTLELQDVPYKVNQTVNEVVKEAVHIALQASLRDRFRELPEADMKEILNQRMFESGSYKSLPRHETLYEALEASMERANRDEFLAKKDESRKRRCDDQDPPSPPPNSDLSKKKRHDSGASGSTQPPAPQSSSWKTFDTRETPSSSSQQKADYKEYKISEADFKNLYPNDFKDLYLLHLQDYTIVSKSRAEIYKDRNDQKKMMPETEVHKFSDGMMNRILEKLDHIVKDFRLFKYNPGMATRIWFEDDSRRSKEFMEVIENGIKIRKFFRSFESFDGGRLRDVDYRLIQRTE